MNDHIGTKDQPLAFTPPWLADDQLMDVLTYGEAVAVLEQALLDGLDPELDGLRTRHRGPAGQLLQMPSASKSWCGTKLVTLRDQQDPKGLPAIQGVYVLFDGASLRPVAMLEGAGLTELRTPAMTALAIRYLTQTKSGQVALFGTGLQARAHVKALTAVFEPNHIAVIGRDSVRAQAFVAEIEAMGISSSVSNADVVSQADLILCCTASDQPLFDGQLIQNHAVVAAIGSHDPYSREVDSALVQRASVVIESYASAQREAGDLIIPYEAGEFEWERATPIHEVIVGEQAIDFTRPRLFKGTGMPWQDLAVASSAYMRTVEPACNGV